MPASTVAAEGDHDLISTCGERATGASRGAISRGGRESSCDGPRGTATAWAWAWAWEWRRLASDLRPASLGRDSAARRVGGVSLWPSARTHLARTPPAAACRTRVGAGAQRAVATRPPLRSAAHGASACAPPARGPGRADQGGLRAARRRATCSLQSARSRGRQPLPPRSAHAQASLSSGGLIRTRRRRSPASSIRKCRGQPVGTASSALRFAGESLPRNAGLVPRPCCPICVVNELGSHLATGRQNARGKKASCLSASGLNEPYKITKRMNHTKKAIVMQQRLHLCE
jgi:hypothetical protein